MPEGLVVAFAAGAMLYVVFDEIIPGGIVGFGLMIVLDTIFA